MNDQSTRYSRAILLLGLIMLFGLWNFVWHQVGFEREKELEQATRAEMNMTKVFEEQVRSVIASADSEMITIKQACEKEGPSSSIIAAILAETRKNPARLQVGVTDEFGRFVVSSYPEALALDYSDREWFSHSRGNAFDSLYLGQTVVSRISGKRVIPLSRRINKPDGTFGGVVHISIDTNHFDSIINRLDMGSDGVISILGRDGINRLRQGQGAQGSGHDMRRGDVWKQLQQAGLSGATIACDVLDGKERLYTYRTLPEYSLYIYAGTSTEAVLASFEQRRKNYIWGAVGVSGFIAALCFLLIDRTRKHEKETVRLLRNAEEQTVLREIAEAAEIALIKANGTLEIKVAERTQEIEAANTELTAQNEEITAMNEKIIELNHKLEEMNDVLEQRVTERTVALTAAHKELTVQYRELNETQESLIDSEARYWAVIEQAPEAILLCDPHTGAVIEANTRFTEQFGYESRCIGTLNLLDMIEDKSNNIREIMDTMVREGSVPLQRRPLKHRNGLTLTVERASTIVSYHGRQLCVMTLRDVSDEVRREQEEHYLATHDELTGHYNRRGFTEKMAELLSEGAEGTLLLVDIDDFKSINDVHGHEAGDHCLAAFGAHLRETVGEAAVIGRFDSDEFGLFFAGPNGLLDATRANGMLKHICLELENGSFFIQISGGISLREAKENNLDILVQKAYVALHHAKESGKWCCKTYEAVLHDKVSRRFALKEALNNALAYDEFHLVFQPVFDIQCIGSKIVGYEALLRWTNPTLGTISPAEFIPVTEETNLIIPIGQWVLKEASRFAVNYWKTSGKFVNIAVNISMRQLAMPNFVSIVKETLRETGLPACNLNLEVTESLLMTDAATRVSYLRELRNLGVAVSLDDFGTGYSSFTYLAKMPITTLKIDKSMVDEIKKGGSRKQQQLLESLLQMCKLLGYKVVAEGVETEEQLLFLKNKGCDYCQGYLLGKPLPEEATLELFG